MSLADRWILAPTPRERRSRTPTRHPGVASAAERRPTAPYPATARANARRSSTKKVGFSNAAKCPPFSSVVCQTWSAAQQLSIPAEGNRVWPPHVAVAPAGDVYVAYHSQPTILEVDPMNFCAACPDGTSGQIVMHRVATHGIGGQRDRRRAAERGAHQHGSVKHVAPDQRRPGGDVAAEIMADQTRHRLAAQRPDQRQRVAHQTRQREGRQIAVVCAVPTGGPAIATLIGCHHVKPGLSQRHHLLSPTVGQLRKAVQ